MSMQLQSTSTVLSVSLNKIEPQTAIKNEPFESEIGIDDIPNSLDEEIIPDVKETDIVSHELSEDLIKSETVFENTFENNYSGSVETQVFVKTENIPLIKTENITQCEYLYKTQDRVQDSRDGNVNRGTSQEVIDVQGRKGSNEYFNALQSDKQFVNCFKDLSDTSRKAKHPDKNKTVKTTSCEKDKKKGNVIEVPVIPLEPHKYTSLAKAKHTCNKNKSAQKQNEKRYSCEKCMYTSDDSSKFKLHQLTHKTKAEIDDRFFKYRCDKCKYKTYWWSSLKTHKLTHLKPSEIHYFYCYHCSYKSKLKGSLQIHIFRHFKNENVPFHCYICDFTTLKRNSIIEHLKKHPKHHSKCDETDYKNQLETYTKKQMRYSCEKCTYISDKSSDYKLHQLTHKTKSEIDDRLFKYRCDKCKYKTCWSSSLKRHKLKHLKPEEIPYFYCYHCPYKCKHKSSLKSHIFNHFKNEDVSFHCYICDFTTLKRNSIIEHLKRHPKHHSKCDETDYKNQLEILYFYCYHCSYKCKLKSGLKVHIFNHFKKEEVSFHCYICDFTTLNRNLIIEHFKKHPKHHSKCDETDYKNQLETYTKKQMRYRCKKCTYTNASSSNFKQHQLTHKTKAEIDDRLLKYHCDKCKYKTCWSTHFKRHKLTHLKPEEIYYFYCYHCSYKSKRKDSLQGHILRHFKNEDVPFHCYICDFTTLKRNLIIEHFKKHPKPYSKCNETDYKNQLEIYTKKQMRYCCEKCTYTSGRFYSFKRHQLTHKTKAEIDDRLLKYHCDNCKYKTYCFNHFKAHKLIHLNPEEIHYFYCYHCSYKSNRKQYLKEHIFRHFKNEEIPFHCYICDFVTLKREFFKKHLKYHNNKRDETEYRNQLLRFYKIL